ncbi:MAG TPA: maleylacetate reductase [Kofleriaceae bacterium]|nr:maleylacetate reductase [Kofleriaceae bacterium]
MIDESFTYTGLPARVVFGMGTLARVPSEADHLAITRALVLTTPQQAEHGRAVVDKLGDRAAGLFSGAVMHTPIDVTEAALGVVRELAANGVVAIGGGSTIGLGKAIAVRTGLPQIAIPTTYAGSEMTPILGETYAGQKTTRKSLDILPETVIYDVDLTLGLPAALSGTSGINAIAHAVEALYAQDRNPITSLLAEQGIAALARALPAIVTDPHDRSARSDALYGAWLCAVCLGSVGMALHHKLCHVLGGTFDLPHAETHTALLPHAVAYNAPAAPTQMARIARALAREGTSPSPLARPSREIDARPAAARRTAQVEAPDASDPGDAALALYDLAGAIGARRSLAELGMPADGLDRAADLAVQTPYGNPRPLDRAAIRELLERAFTGAPPR